MKIFFSIQKSCLIKRISAKGEGVSWVYLAKDYNRLKRLEEEFGNGFERVDISKSQNEAADDIRNSYVRWCDALNESNGKDLQWWFTTVSSRNPSESDLFQFACYLELLRRITDKQGQAPDFVVVESPGLAKEILIWAKSRGIDARISSCFFANLIRINYSLRFFFKWAKLLINLIVRFICARLTRVFYRRNNMPGGSLIINTYVHQGDISEDGIFTDRYFPFLYEYLEKSGFSIKVLPILYGFKFNYFAIFKALRRSKRYFIIPEDYLGVFDYLVAFFSYFRFLRQRISIVAFNGFGMEELVKEEKIAKFTGSLAESILLYRCFIRMRREVGSCKRAILWYENQALHKAIIAGMRKAFPGARIIGAQLFIHRPNLLNLFPSLSEVKRSLIPDLLLATSRYQCEVVTSFVRSLPCQPAAALRYSYLFNHEVASDNTEKVILIILPFDLYEAAELLRYMSSSLKSIGRDYKLLIKAHQDYSIKELKRAVGDEDRFNCFEVYEGYLADILNKAIVVVASNSGVIIEAAARGIPVVAIGRQTVLNQNNLNDLCPEIISQCFSYAQMLQAINQYINLYPKRIDLYKRKGEELRNKFFTPVSKITLTPFVEA